MQINFWDGMTSVPGYGPIRFMDHVYNKDLAPLQATWDTAFTYDLNRMSAMFSRRLSNWAYASSESTGVPSRGSTPVQVIVEAARSPQEVAAQLAAFRKWGTGGAFVNFAYGGINPPSTTRHTYPGCRPRPPRAP